MPEPKKILLSYRFTGEDHNELVDILSQIRDSLQAQGHKVYCSIDDEDAFRSTQKTNGKIMEHAFSQLDDSDVIFAFVRPGDKSEGMFMEIGYAIAKGKVFVLALQKGVVTTSIAELASQVIAFDSVEDLCHKITQTAI